MTEDFLTPEAAARAFRDDPESVWFTLMDMMVQFGLSPEELAGEVNCGALQALGEKNRPGLDHVRITGKSLAEWMSTDRPIAQRARGQLTYRGLPN